MTRAGVLYDPNVPDPVVFTIDGHDLYATGWAGGLDPLPALGHRPGCHLADYGTPAAVCPRQPPL